MAPCSAAASQMVFLIDKIAPSLDGRATCMAQTTCRLWAERMGPAAAHWEERCAATWGDTYWWPWRQSVLGSVGSWQEHWFKLTASILLSNKERNHITQLNGPFVFEVLADFPDGWALGLLTMQYELAALEEPAFLWGGRQKFGRLRVSISHHSNETRVIETSARKRCEHICEMCGVEGCELTNIWGYMCVVCKVCGLSHLARRISREQGDDGHWSLDGKSWESIFTKRALCCVTPDLSTQGAPADHVSITSSICCFLGCLIAELESAVNDARPRSGRADLALAHEMRCAAQSFLEQRCDTAQNLQFACSVSLWDATGEDDD